MPSKHGRGWRSRWSDEHGQRQSETFTKYEDALGHERQMKVKVGQIRTGLATGLVAGRTVGELCDTWLVTQAPRKRSIEDDRSIIRAHIRPVLGFIELARLTTADIDRFAATRQVGSQNTLRNILNVLSGMLRYGVEIGWLGTLPRIKRPRPEETDFRYLRMAEIGTFLQAARQDGETVHALYATAVFTGMRAGELAGLHWSDIDFGKRLITVSRSYKKTTKTGKIRRVPIIDVLLPILREWRLKTPGEIVFPNQVGNMHGKSARIFRPMLHRVLDRAGLQPAQRAGKLRPYITFHGLRHTFASMWVMQGKDIYRLQKILGHSSVNMTMRYAHLAPEAFDDAHDLGMQVSLGNGAVVDLASLSELAASCRSVSA
jgi:integrase